MLKSSLLGISIAVFGLTASAHAAIVDVTYAGLISGSADPLGLFGTNDHVNANGDKTLDGDSITVSYTFDTNAGSTVDTAGSHSASGGTLFGNASPALSVTILINGQVATQQTFSGGQYGVIADNSTDAYSFQSHEADFSEGTYVYSSITAAAGLLPDSITQQFSYSATPDDSSTGYFQINGSTFASFTSVAISETVSPVPLPAALPMFGAAVLALGVIGYSTKRAAKAAQG